ncbi:4Fe-4S ferredoxin [Oceanidesulfovibrio indonesiensis]|uniref:4Fe-4S ferredoxin n=2 Tax=Oceanidesulfovibrio indonesiensis TaxID=54767 RepID=A0A7M3ME65_9BACT|nr:4Fe-4S ferredoxin [Oceanidesulfovibrio indonesiensis]
MSAGRHSHGLIWSTAAAMPLKLTPLRLQRFIQAVFAALCVYIGWRFYQFCLWTQSGAAPPVSKPAGVEGFLPISALMGLKNLALTGTYGPAHPAGLTILLFAIGAAALLRKGFCGFVCPVGLVSNLLSAAGCKLGLERRVPRIADTMAKGLKYPLLGFFIVTVGFTMSGPALQSFLMSRYNLTADAHLMQFFLNPSQTALVVLGVLAGVTLLFRNAWCRWLCPYGALLGLLSWGGVTQVKRDTEACTSCGRCQRACPTQIPVQNKTTVRTPECIGCANCVGACSGQKALSVTMLGRPVHWSMVGLATLGLFIAVWAAAKLTGHWDSNLPPMMLRSLYGSVFSGM